VVINHPIQNRKANDPVASDRPIDYRGNTRLKFGSMPKDLNDIHTARVSFKNHAER
jgi:hypothetical protein